MQSAALKSYLKRLSVAWVLLLLFVITFALLGFFYCFIRDVKNEKIALILDEKSYPNFKKFFKDYTIILITNNTEAEILITNITKEIFNISFYAPIIVMLEGESNIKGIIIGEPSSLFWEEIRSCVNSLNCTPFIAYTIHKPKCDYCPAHDYYEKFEILTKLSTEKTNKLMLIVKSFLKNN